MNTSGAMSYSNGPCPSARPSRAEIELLCILSAIAAGPCSAVELAERLGLAPELAAAVEQASTPAVAVGHLELREGVLSVTDAGRERLRIRLSELGVADQR